MGRINLLFIAILGLSFSVKLAAQDERYWRKLLPRPPEEVGNLLRNEGQFQIQGEFYRYDLNSDGLSEIFSWHRSDGLDFLQVEGRDLKQRLFKLETQGTNSRIFKVRLVDLSDRVRALLVYFYQGITLGHRQEAEIRLYFLSWENNDLKTMKWFKGPLIWMDQEQRKGFYWERPMQVEVLDFNGDGIKEVSVKHQKLQRIFFYLGNGEWAQPGSKSI